ncbi:lytic transglycosylase domain-containing protein [Stenotrophomonas sp. ZAC14D2_NAIMI4_6]|uniref:lytic transglycosylase domain-containing protein n=1 Tax=Stenotrophomonas sp. ZAC14D2_NAIMI4_6 TaxID=2072406 RepID=UPI000D53F0C8|nr:lytic transglycosylase domain-containing protein [Stenotrophomonas sp. ZAC14D2_NAIMI4_6]AWH20984.1 transglycosylase [Stenotrophomonas sp. ZAC14D2_NAIMI4_6]
MKGRLGITAIIIAALTAAPASAGTLYKCEGADGVTSYVSKRVAGARCTTISYTRQPSRPTRPVTPAPTPTPTPTPAAAPVAVASAERNPVAVAASAASPAVAPSTAPVATPRAGRTVSGQVYSYMKDGVRHYTSARPAQVANLGPVRTIRYSFIERCYACGVNPRVDFGSVRLNTTSFQTEIASAAREFGVEEAIVRAIIHAESAYNPTALSRAGAQGLMQLMPPTAARFGVADSYDASQNIRGGVQYLAWLLKRFNGDLTLAAAGYNAGEGAVDRHGGVPPYSETQYYVRRVGQLADRYRTALTKQ